MQPRPTDQLNVTDETITLTREDLLNSRNPAMHFRLGAGLPGTSLNETGLVLSTPIENNEQEISLLSDVHRGMWVNNTQMDSVQFEAEAKELSKKLITQDLKDKYPLQVKSGTLDTLEVGQEVTEKQAQQIVTRLIFQEAMGLQLNNPQDEEIYSQIYTAYIQDVLHFGKTLLIMCFNDFGDYYPGAFKGGVFFNKKLKSDIGKVYRENGQIYYEVVLNFRDHYKLIDTEETIYDFDAVLTVRWKLVDVVVNETNSAIRGWRRVRAAMGLIKATPSKQFELQEVQVSGNDSKLTGFCMMNTMHYLLARLRLAEYFITRDENLICGAGGKIIRVDPWVTKFKLKLIFSLMILVIVVPALTLGTGYIGTYSLSAIGMIGGASLFFGSVPFWHDVLMGISTICQLRYLQHRANHAKEPLSVRARKTPQNNFELPQPPADSMPAPGSIVLTVTPVAGFPEGASLTSPHAVAGGQTAGDSTVRSDEANVRAPSSRNRRVSLRDSMAATMAASPRGFGITSSSKGLFRGSPSGAATFSPTGQNRSPLHVDVDSPAGKARSPLAAGASAGLVQSSGSRQVDAPQAASSSSHHAAGVGSLGKPPKAPHRVPALSRVPEQHSASASNDRVARNAMRKLSKENSAGSLDARRNSHDSTGSAGDAAGGARSTSSPQKNYTQNPIFRGSNGFTDRPSIVRVSGGAASNPPVVPTSGVVALTISVTSPLATAGVASGVSQDFASPSHQQSPV